MTLVHVVTAERKTHFCLQANAIHHPADIKTEWRREASSQGRECGLVPALRGAETQHQGWRQGSPRFLCPSWPPQGTGLTQPAGGRQL